MRPPPDKAALTRRYQERMVCWLFWEENLTLRMSKTVAKIVEVIGEAAAVDVVVVHPTVI